MAPEPGRPPDIHGWYGGGPEWYLKLEGLCLKHKTRFTWCVGACIDMLGVTERMRCWNPQPNADHSAAVELLTDIHYIRTGFYNSKKLHASLGTGVRPHVQVIGDSIHALARLEKDESGDLDFRQVYYLGIDVCTVLVHALIKGIICRGAIELGIIANLPGESDDCLIGPIHAMLHELEQQAVYPRVLIGTELSRAMGQSPLPHGLALASEQWYRDSLQRLCLKWHHCPEDMRQDKSIEKLWESARQTGTAVAERNIKDQNLPEKIREKYAYFFAELQSTT
jgi:hypothetical protein